MSDPRAFALARLGEEEADAREAIRNAQGAEPPAVRSYFIEHGPARTLRRVAALRALVRLHEPWPMGVCGGCSDREITRGREYEHGPIRAEGRWRPYPCRNVRHVVAIWAWHEDYDESWKL